jgi:hypothetical protein
MVTVALTGDEVTTVSGSNDGTKYRMLLKPELLGRDYATNIVASISCNEYETLSADSVYTRHRGISALRGGEYLAVYDERFNTSDLSPFKAFLAERYAISNPVIVTYALAEPAKPTEEALAASFDKKIDVFAGGYIEFKNDKGNAVPSEVAFITGK